MVIDGIKLIESIRRGLEFKSREFTKFLTENGIRGYHIFSHVKAAGAERFIRTLFTKIQRYLTERGTKKFQDKLEEFTQAYNRTIHRSIRMRPVDVTKDNENVVWHNVYDKYFADMAKPRKGPKFGVGDKIRVSREKLIFDKGKYIVLRIKKELVS